MIRYSLKCANDHRFDSWFASGEAYETLRKSRLVTCPDCGNAQIEKTLMAPAVQSAGSPAEDRPLSTPSDPRAEALAALRQEVEANSDYVGMSFSAEARAMHEGRAPERAIYGEAKLEDAKSLIEDGIPVLPLPFSTRRNTS